MVAISILIFIICALLALVVLAQNPKGGGLAAGFTGAQQIGGVQRTADFLEKATWTLSGALMVLCLVSAGIQNTGNELNELEAPVEQAAGDQAAGDQSTGDQNAAEEGAGEEAQ
jgi:preprotein translocase subunit SecG